MKRKRPIIGLFLIWRFSKYIMKKIFKILCFILFLYAGTALFFSDHFYPGTNLNGEKVSLRDKESSKRILQKKVINHNITIIQPDGSKTELDGDTYDLHLNTDADIKNALYLQHSFLWPVNIWKKHNLKQELNVEYDNKELSRIINSLTFMHKENQTYPKSAKPVYKNGSYRIKKEEKGSIVDTKKLSSVLLSSIRQLNTELDLQKADIYLTAKYTCSSTKVIKATKKLNQYISSTINYTEGDCIDSNKIASWLSIDSEMKIKIDENMIKEYVETLAAKYNTAEQEQDFRTISGRMVQVYSDYGWKIDQEKETQQILSDIKTGNPQNRELCYSIQSFTHENNGLGKTYVEIDSYNNKLYYVKDGQLVFDMDCLMGQEMDEVLELKQKRKDALSLFDLNCLAVRYEQRSGFLSSFADNSTDTDYDNDKNKILSLSEGIYLHPVSILDDRELSTNCIHVTQDNMDILYDTLPENIFFICY